MNASQMYVAMTSLASFHRVSADTFNATLCDGNPIIGDGDVYFRQIPGVGMVTINECDGMWCCEVTDDTATGIAQGFGDTPIEAWAQTKGKLDKVLED